NGDAMSTDFVMVIHFHQPTGNFDSVIERASDKCYIPFLKTLQKYPEIKMTFHFTGCLLEWVEKKRPEIISMVKKMSDSGQVEVISGGFYEPILPSIPYRDRIRQIKMLTDYVKKTFSYVPKGAWVAERIWEPSLPSALNEAGIEYVVLDDTHFLYAGLKKDETYGFYITEDNSKTVAVFPSDKTLRYYIPYKTPAECMGYMRSVAERVKDPVFIYGDDGEKFGEWPGTHKWVFEEKWLEKFLSELKKNSNWLNVITLSECYEKRQPKGRVYLPAVSYEEMLEWALPADVGEQLENVKQDIQNNGKEEWYKPFIRGGFWRNFLTKYPESNNMNKKMLYVSDKLEKARGIKGKDEKLFKEAEKALFRGQCNCAYWHGVFGGLYLFHLRRAVYEQLVRSENKIEEMIYGKKDMLECDVLDVDADSFDEVILKNRKISLYFDPQEGGVLKELDSKKTCSNLINSLSRKKETYHRKIIEKAERSTSQEVNTVKTIHDGIQVPEKGIREHLNYDWYSRSSFIDHFFDEGTSKEAFEKCAYNELGDFVIEKYDHRIEKKDGRIELVMTRKGNVSDKKIRIEKHIVLSKKEEGFKVSYKIKNESDRDLKTVFAPELNLTMPEADSDRYELLIDGESTKKGLKDSFSEEKITKVEVRDHRSELSFRISLDKTCGIWIFPLLTVSQSEKAYELNYQSTVIVPRVALDLEPEGTFELDLETELV
ncbi:MAG: alpha-amylase/4-alpha-glucanotransferase domain-containing protein, partial [Candidatus Omnitrophota bacterium]